MLASGPLRLFRTTLRRDNACINIGVKCRKSTSIEMGDMIDNNVRRRRYSGSKLDSNDRCINNGADDGILDHDYSAIECKAV